MPLFTLNVNFLRPLSLTLLWVGLIVYAFFFSPPDNPKTLTLIINLSTGQWQGINAWIITLFNLMGIWPFCYAAILFADGRGQKIPAYPFVIGSFFLGAFVLLPYLILRKDNSLFTGPLDWQLKLYDSKILGAILLLGAIALVSFGLWQGDWNDFIFQWQNSRFLSVMSMDFCYLSLLFSVLLKDDLHRRNVNVNWLWFLLAFIPLFGPLTYLLLRPNLPNLAIIKD